MRIARKLVDYAVPIGIAATALLNAHTVSSLASGMLESPWTPGIAEARAATAPTFERPSAAAILSRNPFDHEAVALAPPVPADDVRGPWLAPACPGVRALVVVGASDPSIAFASLEGGGKRMLRRRGDDANGMRVVFVGADRVWLESPSGLCQARLGAAPPARVPSAREADGADKKRTLEGDLGGKIQRISATEFHVDRGAVDRLLDAQAEMMKVRTIPVREGDRVVGIRLGGIKPGSALSMLGLEDNDRVESINGLDLGGPEKLLEVYARLKAGALDRLTVHVTRAGKPLNLDYVVR
jgi:general secretion pathway protein C